jgi:hypothetical protein
MKIPYHLFLLFALAFSQLTADGQLRVLLAPRVSTIANPEVDYYTRKMGFGAMIKFDWKNEKSRHHFIEFSFDNYKLMDAAVSLSYGIPQLRSYNLRFMKASYGMRAMKSGADTGLYGEAGVGILLSTVKGSSDEELNSTVGITGAFTPGIGYCGNLLDLGMKFTLAPSDGDVVVAPSLHLGIRL